jgi:hypothetical protein
MSGRPYMLSNVADTDAFPTFYSPRVHAALSQPTPFWPLAVFLLLSNFLIWQRTINFTYVAEQSACIRH